MQKGRFSRSPPFSQLVGSTHPTYIHKLQPFHFGLSGRGTSGLALAGLEIVDDVKRYAALVVTLALVNENSASVHRPVIVGGVEYIGCRQFHGQRFV